ncbi:MAG: Hpt domain-containing protein [candidate division WOR-3 bacterium]
MRPDGFKASVALPAVRTPTGDGMLDWPTALACVNGDVKLLQKLVELFIKHSPRLISEIRGAIAKGDRLALMHAAYALKKSVSNFCAWPAFEAALRLELIGCNGGDFCSAEEACAELEREIERLRPELISLAAQVTEFADITEGEITHGLSQTTNDQNRAQTN